MVVVWGEVHNRRILNEKEERLVDWLRRQFFKEFGKKELRGLSVRSCLPTCINEPNDAKDPHKDPHYECRIDRDNNVVVRVGDNFPNYQCRIWAYFIIRRDEPAGWELERLKKVQWFPNLHIHVQHGLYLNLAKAIAKAYERRAKRECIFIHKEY